MGGIERDACAAAAFLAWMADSQGGCPPVWGDTRTFVGRRDRRLESVDVVCAGYPCQPFSAAGRRLRSKDPRHLWPAVRRIVARVQPQLVFFETSTGTSRWGWGKCSGIAKGSATALRRECTARRSGRAASSQTGFILGTARVATNGGIPCPESTGKGCRIEDQAATWATPTAHERTHTPRQVHHGEQLANQVDLWASPQTPGGGAISRSGDRIGELLLGGQSDELGDSEHRATRVRSKSTGSKNGMQLQDEATNWPSAGGRQRMLWNHPGATDSLTGAVTNWPTTTSRDWKVGDLPAECRVGSEALTAEALTAAAEQFPSSRPIGPTTDAGLSWLLSVWTRPSCPRLSPGFQWWLMGWSHPRTFFAAEETASCHSPLPGRFSISPLASSWMSRNLSHLRSLVVELSNAAATVSSTR